MESNKFKQMYEALPRMERRWTRRAVDKMEMLLYENEVLEKLFHIYYGKTSGLLILAEERILYVCREKKASPISFEFYYHEIVDFNIDRGVLFSEIAISTSQQRVVLECSSKSESDEIKNFVLNKMKGLKKNHQRENPELPVNNAAGVIRKVRLLEDVFDESKGWLVDSNKITVNEFTQKGIGIYKLRLLGVTIIASEHTEVMSVGETKYGQNCIRLSYCFETLQLLNAEILLRSNESAKNTSFFGLREDEKIVISNAIPVFHGLSISVARNLLLRGLVSLITDVKSFQEEVNHQDELNVTFDQVDTVEDNSVNWGEVIDFVGGVLDLIDHFSDDD